MSYPTSRAYPRTLAQAFGPHTDNVIYSTDSYTTKSERSYVRLFVLLAVLAVVVPLFI